MKHAKLVRNTVFIKTFNGINSTTLFHSQTKTYSYNTITLNGNQK